MSDRPTHVVAVTGFVTNAERKVLLVPVAERGWELPGGQVEPGEGLLDALRREVEEESGCVVEPTRLLSVDARVTPPELVHVFSCRWVSGTVVAREAAVPEVGWFAPAEARRLVRRSPAAERLRDALDDIAGIRHRPYRMRPCGTLDERILPDVRASTQASDSEPGMGG